VAIENGKLEHRVKRLEVLDESDSATMNVLAQGFGAMNDRLSKLEELEASHFEQLKELISKRFMQAMALPFAIYAGQVGTDLGANGAVTSVVALVLGALFPEVAQKLVFARAAGHPVTAKVLPSDPPAANPERKDTLQ